MKTMQYRAICPACFAQQAIRKSGKMVPHGYTRPQQWSGNVGDCGGVGHMHFGTEKGRDYTRSIAQRCRLQADLDVERSAAVLRGDEVVQQAKRSGRYVSMEVIEAPTQRQRERYAEQLLQAASQLRATAAELDAAVAAWTPVEPLAVEMDKRASAPLLHYGVNHWGAGKACAASYMGGQTGNWTKDITKVTCQKCLASRYGQAALTAR